MDKLIVQNETEACRGCPCSFSWKGARKRNIAQCIHVPPYGQEANYFFSSIYGILRSSISQIPQAVCQQQYCDILAAGGESSAKFNISAINSGIYPALWELKNNCCHLDPQIHFKPDLWPVKPQNINILLLSDSQVFTGDHCGLEKLPELTTRFYDDTYMDSNTALTVFYSWTGMMLLTGPSKQCSQKYFSFASMGRHSQTFPVLFLMH